MSGVSVELKSVNKSFGGQSVLRDVSLSIPAGSFTALLGASGCGKTTLLRIIAGLETDFSGGLFIDQHDVTHTSADRRGLSYVFQNYALFPHLTVRDNIVFGLQTRRVAKQIQHMRLNEVVDLLGISALLDRKPAALSGGQQQRVALARALIGQRPLCLMDEPLSNLDAKLRQSMRVELRELQQKLGFTMVYVTHDQIEAVTMADRVALMKQGEVVQYSTPKTLYTSPVSTAVAEFIGTPPMNLISAEKLLAWLGISMSSTQSESPATLGFRPEDLKLSNTGAWCGRIQTIEYLGADALTTIASGDLTFQLRVPGSLELNTDDAVRIAVDACAVYGFDTTGLAIDIPELAQNLARASHTGELNPASAVAMASSNQTTRTH